MVVYFAAHRGTELYLSLLEPHTYRDMLGWRYIMFGC